MFSNDDFTNLQRRVGELENRTEALEIRMDGVQEYQKNVANALAQLKKRKFFATDITERNWMIYSAATYLKWTPRAIAGKFNLTTQQISKIVNAINVQYGY